MLFADIKKHGTDIWICDRELLAEQPGCSVQTLAARYLLQHGKDMKPAVYTLPHELDTKIASIKLAAMGYQIDTLTEAQRKYLGLD